MESRVLTGAAIHVFINGQLVPEVQNISYTEQKTHEPIFGIDTPFAQELAVTRYLITGTINGINLHRDRIKTTRIKSKFTNILSAPYIKITIKNRKTGAVIMDISRAVVTSHNFNASVKTTSKFSMSFTGIFAK